MKIHPELVNKLGLSIYLLCHNNFVVEIDFRYESTIFEHSWELARFVKLIIWILWNAKIKLCLFGCVSLIIEWWAPRKKKLIYRKRMLCDIAIGEVFVSFFQNSLILQWNEYATSRSTTKCCLCDDEQRNNCDTHQ